MRSQTFRQDNKCKNSQSLPAPLSSLEMVSYPIRSVKSPEGRAFSEVNNRQTFTPPLERLLSIIKPIHQFNFPYVTKQLCTPKAGVIHLAASTTHCSIEHRLQYPTTSAASNSRGSNLATGCSKIRSVLGIATLTLCYSCWVILMQLLGLQVRNPVRYWFMNETSEWWRKHSGKNESAVSAERSNAPSGLVFCRMKHSYYKILIAN